MEIEYIRKSPDLSLFWETYRFYKDIGDEKRAKFLFDEMVRLNGILTEIQVLIKGDFTSHDLAIYGNKKESSI